MHRLLLLAIALIVYGSLYPWHFDFARGGADPLGVLLGAWPRHINRFLLRDAAVNLLLYFPLGMAAVLAAVRRHSRAAAWGAAVLIAVALSAGIEMLQIYDPGRVCSLFDVLCNVLGAAGGAAAALLFRPELESLARRRPGRQARAAVLLLGCWAGFQLYPLFPMLSRTRLRAEWALLARPASIAAVEVWASAAEWFAAALLMEALLGRMRARWLLAAMVCLPLRLFMAGRTLALSEVLGAALALLLWSVLREKLRLRAALWMLASAIVLRELAPFRFSELPSRFSWIPFGATLDSENFSAVLVIFRKAFEYGAAVWLLRARGVSYAPAGVTVAAALAVLEAAQRYLPGRTPEITDSVLALLLALVLWRLSDSRSRRGLG